MRKSKSSKILALGAATLLISCLAGEQARAADFVDGKLSLNVYGDVTYTNNARNRSQDNDATAGQYASEAAINLSYRATDTVTLTTQIAGSLDAINLDTAYVDYRYSNLLKLRGGMFRSSTGLYNETRDIKYLHTSVTDPLLYNTDNGLTAEVVQGLGAYVRPNLGDDSSLEIALYAGDSLRQPDDDATPNFHNIIGGRLLYTTPIEGLTLAFSANHSFLTVDSEGSRGNSTLALGSVEYKHANLKLRGEYGYLNRVGAASKKSGYLEVGYTVLRKFTPFARFDYVTTDTAQKSDPSFYQKAVVAGIDYKMNSNFSLRAEDSIINGYAVPVAGGDVTPGAGSKNWNMFATSLNFIF
jgi:hypothetical protein